MAKRPDYKNQHVLTDFSWPEDPRCHFHEGVQPWTDGVVLPTGTAMLNLGGQKYCPECAHKHGLITQKLLDELDDIQAQYDMEQMLREQEARKQAKTGPKPPHS